MTPATGRLPRLRQPCAAERGACCNIIVFVFLNTGPIYNMFLFFKDTQGETPGRTVVSGESERENRGKVPGAVFGLRGLLKNPMADFFLFQGHNFISLDASQHPYVPPRASKQQISNCHSSNLQLGYPATLICS